MVKFSERVMSISESPTLATSAKVKALIAAGTDVLNLSVGEPDFEAPQAALEAASKAILGNKANHYTPTAGILQLRQAITDYHSRQDDIHYQPDEVIVTEGAKNALYLLIQTVIDPGDEVLIPVPYWVSYSEQVKLAGGKNILIDTTAENDFKVTVEQLQAQKSSKTVALILNSPSNPTGSIYSREELEDIGNWCVENDILIISDEIYNRLCYNGAEAFSIASLSDAIKKQTVVINGVSKTFAMTGWRIGYAMGDKELIKKMTEVASHSTSNPVAASQYAALEALTNAEPFVVEMVKAFEKRLNFFFPLIESIPGFSVRKAQGAFYLFADVKQAAAMTGFATVDDFVLQLLEEAHVSIVPGEGFGMPDYARISYTLSEKELEDAVQRIKQFISNRTSK